MEFAVVGYSAKKGPSIRSRLRTRTWLPPPTNPHLPHIAASPLKFAQNAKFAYNRFTLSMHAGNVTRTLRAVHLGLFSAVHEPRLPPTRWCDRSTPSTPAMSCLDSAASLRRCLRPSQSNSELACSGSASNKPQCRMHPRIASVSERRGTLVLHHLHLQRAST